MTSGRRWHNDVMIPVLLVAVLGGAAALVAARLRRGGTDAPEQSASWEIPVQLDRTDFERPDAPWLVALFSSSTCLACAGTWEKTEVLASEAVSVQRLDAVDDKVIHDRYRIDAVPMLLIAGADGIVQRHFLGEPTATDLWAAVAAVRQPGSVPDGCGGASSGPCGSTETPPTA